jgi:hypothetical protein
MVDIGMTLVGQIWKIVKQDWDTGYSMKLSKNIKYQNQYYENVVLLKELNNPKRLYHVFSVPLCLRPWYRIPTGRYRYTRSMVELSYVNPPDDFLPPTYLETQTWSPREDETHCLWAKTTRVTYQPRSWLLRTILTYDNNPFGVKIVTVLFGYLILFMYILL